MITYVALLRGINVGSHNKIKMNDLVRLLESIPLSRVATYIQSGNIIFQSKITSRPVLKDQLQSAINHHFGMDVTVLLRTKVQWQALVANNPFLPAQDPAYLHVTLFDRAPDEDLLHEVETIKSDATARRGLHQSIYLYCPQGYGRTKLSNTFLEKKLKLKATTRNWKTVRHLLAMAEGM